MFFKWFRDREKKADTNRNSTEETEINQPHTEETEVNHPDTGETEVNHPDTQKNEPVKKRPFKPYSENTKFCPNCGNIIAPTDNGFCWSCMKQVY